MALVTVHDEGSADVRSKNRWSATKGPDVVLRLLRGEELEEVSREVGIEAHRLDEDPTFETIWERCSKRDANRGQCRGPARANPSRQVRRTTAGHIRTRKIRQGCDDLMCGVDSCALLGPR